MSHLRCIETQMKFPSLTPYGLGHRIRGHDYEDKTGGEGGRRNMPRRNEKGQGKRGKAQTGGYWLGGGGLRDRVYQPAGLMQMGGRVANALCRSGKGTRRSPALATMVSEKNPEPGTFLGQLGRLCNRLHEGEGGSPVDPHACGDGQGKMYLSTQDVAREEIGIGKERKHRHKASGRDCRRIGHESSMQRGMRPFQERGSHGVKRACGAIR